MQRTVYEKNKKDTPDLEVTHNSDRHINSPFNIKWPAP